MHPSTIAVTAGRPSEPGHPLNQPIVLASNVRGSGDYVRTHGTATWEAFEQALGALEGGEATAFSTGMAAASAALFAFAPKVIVLPTASYLGVRTLVDDLVERTGLVVRPVDVSDTGAVVAAIPGADLVWIETPANPTLDVADVVQICAAATAHGVPTLVDSTFATPIVARPIEDGATVVMHSATKFIGGHSDLVLGALVTRDAAVHEAVRHARLVNGATPGALETFLALRGLRTLPLRMERSQASARVLASRLGEHPGVDRVRYPGFGAMVSFDVRGGAPAADALCAATRVIVPATSLGGVETTMERRQKYAGDAHVPPGLVRMSVGIEHVEDLWADLLGALDAAAQLA